MRKKAAKSKEQKLAENYFPVDATDVKYAIEKVYKPAGTGISQVIETKARKKKPSKSKKNF